VQEPQIIQNTTSHSKPPRISRQLNAINPVPSHSNVVSKSPVIHGIRKKSSATSLRSQQLNSSRKTNSTPKASGFDQNEPSTSSTSNNSILPKSGYGGLKSVNSDSRSKLTNMTRSGRLRPESATCRKSKENSIISDQESLVQSISAHSYVIYDCVDKRFLLKKKESMKREVASLTKMMTLYTVMKLLVRYKLSPRQVQIQISRNVSKISGTSAELREGDILTVEQLCYGMMLPSGNDAALALSEYFGQLLHDKKEIAVVSTSQYSQFINMPTKYFLKEMNANAQKLNMKNTLYDSPHGLMNKSNYSSAEDQAILVAECMKIVPFRRIVNTEVYETKPINNSKNPHLYRWENTNKLLGVMEGIIGTKTGITNSAGPCFAGYYELNGKRLALILCHSKSMDSRWEEIRNMVSWAEPELDRLKAIAQKERAKLQAHRQNQLSEIKF
jgi:serine-type D-Ala-D-Ala carboxypeptidase (penicillin-binding protein 5/6)